MTDLPTPAQIADICLLLRAHSEQRWLLDEVLPVLRELEQPQLLPEDQLGAAFAYLEALAIEAHCRAAGTERALSELRHEGHRADPQLLARALHHHAAVSLLRERTMSRIHELLALGCDSYLHEPAGL